MKDISVEPSSDASYRVATAADVEALRNRISELQGALLWIAETDWHYRKPPAPKPDGGMRGWAGRTAVAVLTGLNGSFYGDAEVRAALAAGQADTGKSEDGSSPQIPPNPTKET